MAEFPAIMNEDADVVNGSDSWQRNVKLTVGENGRFQIDSDRLDCLFLGLVDCHCETGADWKLDSFQDKWQLGLVRMKYNSWRSMPWAEEMTISRNADNNVRATQFFNNHSRPIAESFGGVERSQKHYRHVLLEAQVVRWKSLRREAVQIFNAVLRRAGLGRQFDRLWHNDSRLPGSSCT